MDPRDALAALGDKVDAFVARVEARHGDQMRCARGCDGCCRVSLTVTGVEAARLARHVAGLPADARACAPPPRRVTAPRRSPPGAGPAPARGRRRW